MSTLQRPRLLPNFSSLVFDKVREELELFVPEILKYTDCSPVAWVLFCIKKKAKKPKHVFEVISSKPDNRSIC